MSAQVGTAANDVADTAASWMVAAFRRDLDACARILADDFTMVTDRGSQIDKTQWLSNVQHRVGGDVPPEFLDARIRVLGDTALMTSRNILRASFDGKEWSAELYLTDLWIRQDGRWQILRRHASRVVPDAS
jgi:ketosteroid isomerase-like protein